MPAMNYYLGIDGGGSSLRIVIVNSALDILSEISASTANPNIIGHDVARQLVQGSIQEAIHLAGLSAGDITAVGVGIAGASHEHSEDWLRETIQGVLPETYLVCSSDFEIALVGALGQRHGVLILAGTGSIFFGRNPQGESLRIGGWGYLLGDEGSGYWMGLQALKKIIHDFDETDSAIDFEQNQLNKGLLDYLGLKSARDLIGWLYKDKDVKVKAVAQLAHIIIEEAEKDNPTAISMVQSAANELVKSSNILKRRLNYPDPDIAFAGGMLSNDNLLVRELTRQLDLSTRPNALYRPVVGAALLAKMEWEDWQSSR